jgi:hypothetical protein
MILSKRLLNAYLLCDSATHHNDKDIKHGMQYAAYQHLAIAFEYDAIEHNGTQHNDSLTT